MKNLLFAAALALCVTLPAAAGDLPAPQPQKKKDDEKKPAKKKPKKGRRIIIRPAKRPKAKPLKVLLAELQHKDPKVRVKAVRALATKIPADAIPALMKSLGDLDATVRGTACETLAGFKDKAGPAVPLLIECLGDKDERVVGSALFALQSIGPEKALDPLLKALTHKNAMVRVGALEVMQRFQDKAKQAVPTLRKMLKDSSPDVRQEAARTLGAVRTKAAAAALVDALNTKDRGLRIVAARALKWFGPKGEPAVPALTKALLDKHWKVVDSAAQALGRIGEKAKAAIPSLVQLLDHRIWNLRRSAVRALAGIGVPSVPFLIKGLTHKARNVRVGSAQALGKIGTKASAAVPALILALKDSKGVVRRAAAEALGAMSHKAEKAVGALQDLEENDDDRRVQRAAREALKKIQADF